MKVDEYLDVDIEHGLVNIIDREITLLRTLEKCKRELATFTDYSALNSFHEVEKHEGKIDANNLDSFLRENGHQALDLELLAIIRRMDADGDATISFNEWCEYMRPHASLYKGPPVVPGYIPK